MASFPVLYERNLRSALPLLRLAPRGCLLFCVGSSEAVRAQVEEDLAARLGSDKALVRGSLSGIRADLWRVLVRERDSSSAPPVDTVLSFRLGADDPADPERLFRLNVGREARVLERLRLLLWLNGFEQLEALRTAAPDLWAYRSDVHFYLSRADFEVPLPEVAEPVEGLDAQLADLDSRLQLPLMWEEERIRLLNEKAQFAEEQGHDDKALRLLDKAEKRRERLEFRGEQVDRGISVRLFMTRCIVLRGLGRTAEVRSLAEDARRRAIISEDTLLACIATSELARTRKTVEAYGEAITACDAAIQLYDRLREDGLRLTAEAGPVLVNRAGAWANIGVLARAEADANKAEQIVIAATPKTHAWHWMVRSFVEKTRAEVAMQRGRLFEELLHGHLQCSYRTGIQAWHRLDEAMHSMASAYRRLGLLGDARSIAEQALDRLGRAGAQASRGFWLSWLGDLAADTGDLTEAAQRYEAAVATFEALRSSATHIQQAALMAIAAAKIHGEKWAALSSGAAALHRKQAERLLRGVLGGPASIDLRRSAELALGRLYRASARFDDAFASLAAYRDWARAEQGPARVARACIELGLTSLERGDAGAALRHFSEARAELHREEPRYRSRFVQKEILVAEHEAQKKAGDLASARASLDEALSVVRAEDLRLAELSVLQLLAELEPAPGCEDHRTAAANEAIAIAREAMWFSEEARALATLAALAIDAGKPEARALVDEVAWIAGSVGPEALRRRAEELQKKLSAAAGGPSAAG